MSGKELGELRFKCGIYLRTVVSRESNHHSNQKCFLGYTLLICSIRNDAVDQGLDIESKLSSRR